MSITVQFECGGCFKSVPGTTFLSTEFRSVSGRAHGFGGQVMKRGIAEVTPEGWIAFDPYTACTYCPECWKSIVDEPVEAEPVAEGES